MTDQPLDSFIEDDPDAAKLEDTGAPTAIEVYKADLGVFKSEDIAPPLLKLGQGLSPEVQSGEATPGQWILQGFEPMNDLTIVPVAFARMRQLRDEDDGQLLCESKDGETGEGAPGGICADCPMNKWTGEGKKRKPPQCVFFYSYIVYVHEFAAHAVMNFKRSALGTGKMLNSTIARRGFNKTVVTLGSKQQQGPKGVYYIPAISQPNEEMAEEALIAAAAEGSF